MAMTSREFLTAIANRETVTEEMISKAQEMLASLDRRNEKRRAPESKAKTEAETRRMLVLGALENTPMSRSEIAAVTGLTEGQVTSACTALVKAGYAIKTEVKDGKRKKMVYAQMIV